MKLWWRAGWRSALVEAQAAEYGIDLELIELDDPVTGPEAQKEWAALNPLQQLPTIQLDDGQVMVESAAITLWLADHTGSDLLVPGSDAPEYPSFLRWLIWMAASICPCATYHNLASDLVMDPIESRGLESHLVERMQSLWLQSAEEAGTPWFLGERYSAIDLYIAIMLRWGPGLDWAAEHAPRLYNIAIAASERPAIAPVIAHNFPDAAE